MKLRSNRGLQRGRRGIENEDLTIMKLRSNRVLKRAEPDIENQDCSDNLSNGENGASEGEIEVCADDADENVEMGMKLRSNRGLQRGRRGIENEDLAIMKLRSNRVLKRAKPDIENQDLSDNLSNGENGASEGEIEVCADGADENVEMGMNDGVNVNVDDKGVFLGSEVLDPVKDSAVSRPKQENESVHVDCEIDSIHVDCESGSENLDSGNGDKMADDDIKQTLLYDTENANVLGKGRRGRRKKNVGNVKKNRFNQDKIDGELTVRSSKRDRERKRKIVGHSDGRGKKGKVEKDEDHISMRVLRSRTMTTISDGTMAVDGGLRETAIGLKGLDESIQLAGNDGHNRKSKRHVKPPSDGTMAVDGGLCETAIGLKGLDESIQLAGNDRHNRKSKHHVKPPSDSTMAVDGGLREMAIGLKGLDESIQLAGNDRHNRKSKHHVKPPSDGTMAADGGLHETVLDLKQLDESIQLAGNDRHKRKSKRHVKPPNIYVDENPRPKKKLKRRGRPPKFPIEVRGRGRPPKFPIEVRGRGRPPKFPIEVRGRGRPPKFPIERRGRGRPRKIVSQDVQVGPTELRGRPRQFQGKERMSQRIKDLICKKLKKRRGKPIKREAKILATHVLKMRTAKLMEIKERPEIQKNEEMEKGEENGEHLARREQKQLIREKISDMLLKSGWTIELKQRQEKTHLDASYVEPNKKRAQLDAIYVEPNRKRAHWSTTKAYAMLKKKIEEGDADDNEISAYYPIPQEEISMLFRQTTKKLGDEKKKNKMHKKKVNKGKIISNKKKKVFKKTKNGSKKKHGKKITERSKPRLLVRGSEKGSQKDNNGGLVAKNRNLLSFMIDSGVILVGSKVQYGKARRQKKSYEGTITSDGICCSCCNEVMGISEFVSHFGGNTSQGFDNVYLESGMCLRKCLVDSWRRQEELNSLRFDVVVDVKGDDRNDDACNICSDGGNLICCDSCPSTFHQSCLDIQNFPSGDWNCNYCSCKFCGVLSVTIPQVDDSHDAVASEMLSCCLCEDKFHLSCLQEVEDVNIESNGQSFCGKKCQELFKQLQTYLGVKHELEDGFSWSLLQRSDIDQDLTVHDAQLKVEHNSKLAVAFSVMDECFLPINDKRSGTNIIHNVVYNCSSNFKRLNYSGFVTAVLEKGDELITVASIRVHGYRLAEMPFIGTRQMYRRQGMCRRLLDAIESCLSSIGVEELIIPAIPELLQTWTKVFGFMRPEESLKQAMKSMSMIVFPGIDMLKKPLFLNRAGNANSSPSTASDENIVECINKQNDENVTQLEIASSKEHARKDVIESAEYNKKPVDAAEDVNGVSDHKQTEEVVMDRCSCPSVKNDKLITSESPEGLCDLNFPVNNGGLCDTDGQLDSEPFQDGTNEPTSMDFMTSEVKGKLSPLSSELVPKNTFDLNLQPTGVEIDMNILSDESVQC